MGSAYSPLGGSGGGGAGGQVEVTSMPLMETPAGWVMTRTTTGVLGWTPVLQALVNKDGADSDQVVAAPGAGNKIYVLGYELSPSAATNVSWLSAANLKAGPLRADASGWGISSSRPGCVICNENEALMLLSTAAVDVDGSVTYVILPTA